MMRRPRLKCCAATSSPTRSRRWLLEAKLLLAQSYIKDVDLLIIDQIGKDISGDGMDPNITGRFCNPYVSGGMNAAKMAILDLSADTHADADLATET